MGSAESKPAESKPAEDGRTRSIKPYRHSDNVTSIKLNSSHRALYDGVVSLIEKNKYSDLLVICGNDRYPVHRAIVCPRSTWFEDKCEPALQHADHSSPASPMKIWLDPGEDSHIIAARAPALLRPSHDQNSIFSHDSDAEDAAPPSPSLPPDEEFILSSTPIILEIESHPPTSREESQLPTRATSATSHGNSSTHTVHADPGNQPNELVLHAKMCLAGNRFGIPPLYEVAKEKFEKRLRSEASKAEMLLCIHEVERQQGNCDIIRDLRESLLKSAQRRFRELKQMDGLKRMVVDCPEFAAELMKNL